MEMRLDLTAPRCLYGKRLEVQRHLQAVVRERRNCDSWRNVAALSDVRPIIQDNPEATAIQFGIFSEFLSDGDTNVERWWLLWVPSVLAANDFRQKLDQAHDDYISWILDGMRSYWWFTAALLDNGGAAFYLPTTVRDDRLSQFRLKALELFVQWLPEIDAASNFFQSGSWRGEEMRAVWPKAIFRLARECGYYIETSQLDLPEKSVEAILREAGVVEATVGRPQLRSSAGSP